MPPSTDESTDIRQLEPTELWGHFADLNAVPRPSKQEARVVDFVRKFGESLGLDVTVDAIGNVVIRKPASPGYEHRTPVILQSHLDMVHQKNADTEFDFLNQGIQMRRNGDWVHAEGTTLGADNGIGVAAIMAVLANPELRHPPLEALLTVDEETGMTGAKQLAADAISGRILLNLDTEEDDELTIGCAGGVDLTGRGSYSPQATTDPLTGFQLTVRGLTGGHSGMDIHRGRGNANLLMNRLLERAIDQGAVVAAVTGGGLRNAIPRESTATIGLPQGQTPGDWWDQQRDQLLAEYAVTDPDLVLACSPVPAPHEFVPDAVMRPLVATLFGIANGIVRMSPTMDDLVQTSNNLARVEINDGRIELDCLTRSSVDSERLALARAISSVMKQSVDQVTVSGDYPGWEPDPDSAIVKLMRELYVELFDQQPQVAACHAGLECGLLGEPHPKMEMISFGPTIRGAHSPDEKVCISSVRKFWTLLLATLQRIP